MDTIESEEEDDAVTGSNRRIDIHDLARLLEASSTPDCELLLAFLLGMVYYPNVAIANRTWAEWREVKNSNGIRPANEWTFLVNGERGEGVMGRVPISHEVAEIRRFYGVAGFWGIMGTTWRR